jgi:hypothetical protein
MKNRGGLWMNYRGLLLVIVLALLPAAPATACEPINPAEYLGWYDFNLWIDPAPLPANVTVVAGLYSKSIIVQNSGPTPLYVIAPSGRIGVDQSLPLPEGWVATHKLEDGRLFNWQDGHWRLDESIIEASLSLDSASISPTLVPESPSGPSRPDAIPEPSSARVSLLYDNERLDVPITLKYSLNPAYDPAKYARIEGEPCGFGGLLVPFERLIRSLVLCLFVLAFSVLLILIWFVRSAPKPPSIQ